MSKKEIGTLLPQEKANTWNSEPLLYQLQQAQQELKRLLNFKRNLVEYLREYGAYEREKNYEKDEDGGVFVGEYGTGEEEVTIHTQRFIDFLESQGKDSTRAHLENRVAEIKKAFREDEMVKPGDALILVSPRGKEDEGYPGEDEKNLIYVNIVVMNEDGSFSYTQLTQFHRHEEVQQVLFELQKEHGATLYSPPTQEEKRERIPIARRENRFFNPKSAHQALQHSPVKNHGHVTISTALHLPAQTMGDFRSDEFVESGSNRSKCIQLVLEVFEKHRPRHLDHLYDGLPIISNQEALNRLLFLATNTVTKRVVILLNNKNIGFSTLVALTDKMVQIARDLVRGWVEKHADNYRAQAITGESIKRVVRLLEEKLIALEEADRAVWFAQANKHDKHLQNKAKQAQAKFLALEAIGNVSANSSFTRLYSIFGCTTGAMGNAAKLGGSNFITRTFPNGETWEFPSIYNKVRLQGSSVVGDCDVELRDDPYATLLSTGHPKQHEHHNFDNTHHSRDKYSDSPHPSGNVETIGSFVAALI